MDNDQTPKKCPLCGLVDGVIGWVKQPFNPHGTALQWIGFLGLLIVAAWFWQVILLDLREEI